ncbi:MAG: GNAT family N-acetyltransferase [Kiloniellales bacterium]|nr:GNAT family N-acetyltransferase [Kiloniellales bacterium]
MVIRVQIDIRYAMPEDAPQIASLHVLSWRASYRGVLPDSFLDGEIDQERGAAWEKFFSAPPPGAAAFVAYGENGDLMGFLAMERGNEGGYDAVIENLHVSPRAQGRGLGKRLLGRAASHLIENNGTAVCLWVYEQNRPAIDFYLRLGGRIDARGTDPFAGADALECRIGWHDLPSLKARCG